MDRADFFNDDGDAEDEYEDGEDNGDSDGPDFCIMRPPSRQRPPPEALHLFNAPGTSSSAALKPSLSIMKGSDSKPLVSWHPAEICCGSPWGVRGSSGWQRLPEFRDPHTCWQPPDCRAFHDTQQRISSRITATQSR